ncbi:MAG: O-acetylhomoserine aminocarboxypropyltransferase/cysteine synthase family protein [Eubacteriales bacterium]|nr:O-acetylhomoserine aminocarboxypropyltransferase/cysteine synthase [Clostridiales bacterium]MDD7393111.1 O-acetylhomoserine aminocarboxypropyltransferase/cysteine synthase [Eubacteriales bacterium]MDY3761195.1 O-acetylhomoserine aminocarboxypropyltransferase/cysteine synthase family protein [Eubacteriales bacterium]
MSENIRDPKNWSFETKQLHIGQESPDPATDARAVPIYASSSFVFRNSAHAADRFGLRDAGNIYGRLTNPTNDIFEKRIAALENGVAALATASGAAAINYTILALARAGEHIVSSKNIYGGTYNLLAHTLPLSSGITATFVDPHDPDEIEQAIRPETKALYIETLGNPNSDVSDIEGIAQIAHRHGIPLVVDSTFATPYLIRPIEHGADIVVHSATKFIGGHGTAIGGVIVDGGSFDWKKSGKYPWISDANPSYHGISFSDAVGPAAFATYIRAILLRDTGSTLSPFHAFLFLQGLETLSLRVERHVSNTLKIVEYLASHPKVEAVHHPSLASEPTHALYEKYFPNGGGSIFTFEIKGGAKEAQKFIDNLAVFSLLANVADVKSLVIHPASTTHSQLTEEELLDQGIKPNTIRLSIGTENVKDLIAALDEAFSAVEQ